MSCFYEANHPQVFVFGRAHGGGEWGVALHGVTSEGSWPMEFEPLRKQSRTLVHLAFEIHEIKINNCRELESIWPRLLKFKSKGGALSMHGIRTKDWAPR